MATNGKMMKYLMMSLKLNLLVDMKLGIVCTVANIQLIIIIENQKNKEKSSYLGFFIMEAKNE